MPSELLYKSGTDIIWSGGATYDMYGIDNLLTSSAAQGAKADLGATRPPLYSVEFVQLSCMLHYILQSQPMALNNCL